MATMPAPARGADAKHDPFAELREPEGLTGALLRHITEGFCVVGTDGKIEYADARFCAIFGYSESEMLLKKIDQLDGTGMVARIDAQEHEASGSKKTVDIECTRKDGQKILCAWSGSRIGGSAHTRHLLVVQDVTNRRRGEALQLESQQRLQEIQRLRQLDQVKTQFINNAAHELKTPLTPVKVQTHLLRTVLAAGLSPDQTQSIEILHRNIERLKHLVDDVLEAARIQANKLKVTMKPLDLNPLVLETVESFKSVAAQVGVAIEWRYCDTPHVEGDWERLTQVVYNLLSNAVKFTPPGGRVTLETSKSHTEAFLRIKDTGIGMNGDQISRLFQPFGQVHDPMQDTRAGTGLGLFISHGIIQEHGGRIWAESPGTGRGSTFVVSLPLTSKPLPPTQRPLSPERLSMRPPRGGKQDPALARRLRELI
jgi:PAS domain S-box-containing protein